MPLTKSEIKKILVISLTNIGDVVLTFPVLDILRRDFPESSIKIIVSPKAVSLLKNNPHFQSVEVFDKHQSPKKTVPWILSMRREKFDLVVDLRNTAIPILIAPKYRTVMKSSKNSVLHMREKHLAKLKTVYMYKQADAPKISLWIDQLQRKNILSKLINAQGQPLKNYIVVSPGAANRDKRWLEEGFAQVCDRIIEDDKLDIVFVGDWEDKKISHRIMASMTNKAVNLCGETSLLELSEIIRGAKAALVNDSAPMHLASYLNIPTLAIFGPSDPKYYGPWSDVKCVIQNQENCTKCQNPKSDELHRCMSNISADEVLEKWQRLYREIKS